MWEIDVTLVEGWLLALDQEDYDLVVAALEGRPLVDTLTASRHRNLKELRPGSAGRSKVRILFAFDPRRRAILLVAGDKAGDWTRWYRRMIPIAERLLDEHLAGLERRGL